MLPLLQPLNSSWTVPLALVLVNLGIDVQEDTLTRCFRIEPGPAEFRPQQKWLRQSGNRIPLLCGLWRVENELLDPLIQPLNLSGKEMVQLQAFLETLSSIILNSQNPI
jgi:hypothetical protein